MPASKKPIVPRDLEKVHTLRRRPFFVGKSSVEMQLRGPKEPEHGKIRMRTVFVAKDGTEKKERRRLNPPVAGRFGKNAEITGTARELFQNLGLDQRDKLGTKSQARERKRNRTR